MSQTADYQDFEIQLYAVGPDQFRAIVTSSPAGRPGPMPDATLPILAAELDTFLVQVEAQIRRSAQIRDAKRKGEPLPPESPFDFQAFGQQLFDSLLPPKIETPFRISLALAQGSVPSGRHSGVRLRLTFQRGDDLDAFSLLSAYPWELLYDGKNVLAIHTGTPIVRSIGDRRPVVPVMAEPLRILLVNSQPSDLPRLRTDEEENDLIQALEENPHFDARSFDGITLRTLRDTLRAGGFHGLHFMGHGGFQESASGETVLYFEDEVGKAEPITGPMLAEYLQDLPDLRLIVLNNCWGAAFDRKAGQDPFSSAGAALADAGIPAVVAMQQPITDRAALCFSKTFYEQLAKGVPIAAATTEARLDVWGQDAEALEWATPVLFLRDDDRLFEAPAGGWSAPKAPPNANVIPIPQPKSPLFLRVQTFLPAHLAGEEDLDDHLDLTGFFEGPDNRFCRSQDLWLAEIFPRLEEFLSLQAAKRRPLVFDFPANWSVVFAAGYCLEAKSGLEIRLYQKSQMGIDQWEARQLQAGPTSDQRLWVQEPDFAGTPAGGDVAGALEITHEIQEHVRDYLAGRGGPTVGRVLPLTLFPKPDQTGVQNGRHAWQLAHSAVRAFRKRSFDERRGTLHLFSSAPNTFNFFLGQLAGSLGKVQLYEHDFKNQRHGTYEPSLLLPPPEGR